MYQSGVGFLIVVCMSIAGCSGSPPRIEQPSFADEAGQAAIEVYDANGDGAISGSELEAVPSLKSSLARIDTNRDGKLVAEEIDRRVNSWKESRVGLASCVITIREGGTPVSGVEVTMTPERFLGDNIRPAKGVTNKRGMAIMRMSDDPNEAGACVGFYRVHVSKKFNGKEIIPARYNTDTALGFELAADVFDSRNPFFDIRNR